MCELVDLGLQLSLHVTLVRMRVYACVRVCVYLCVIVCVICRADSQTDVGWVVWVGKIPKCRRFFSFQFERICNGINPHVHVVITFNSLPVPEIFGSIIACVCFFPLLVCVGGDHV